MKFSFLDDAKRMRAKEANLAKISQTPDHPRYRSISVTVRMSEDERALLEDLYLSSGVASRQAYLLGCVLQKPVLTEATRQEYYKLEKKIDVLIDQVKGIATNVNQMAKHVNTHKDEAAVKTISKLDKTTEEYLATLEAIYKLYEVPLSELPSPPKKKKKPKQKPKPTEDKNEEG